MTSYVLIGHLPALSVSQLTVNSERNYNLPRETFPLPDKYHVLVELSFVALELA